MQFFKKYDMAIYWIVLILAIVFSVWQNGITYALAGVLAGAILMELVAKGSYILLKNNTEEEKEEETSEQNEETNYVDKNQRTFSEANTYLLSAAGAIVGWKLVPIILILAILLQVILIIPQFLINLYKQKKYRLVFSITAFTLLCATYLTMKMFIKPHFYVVCGFAILMIFFAFDSIKSLREKINTQGYYEIPFGSFLIAGAIVTYFYGAEILNFLLRYLFRIG